jgi:hypothetical protein
MTAEEEKAVNLHMRNLKYKKSPIFTKHLYASPFKKELVLKVKLVPMLTERKN